MGARPGSLTVQNATDPEGDALTYTFELASDAEFTTVLDSGVDVEEGTTTTSWTPASATTFTAGSTYYWRVTASDGVNTSVATAASAFTIAVEVDVDAIVTEATERVKDEAGCAATPVSLWMLLPLVAFFRRRRR